MRIGWIGLGLMGRPMVENLVRAGLDVTVQNRSQGKVQELVALGAKPGGTFAEMAASVDSIHTCLPDLATVQQVMRAPDGIFVGARPGLVIVDHSTIHPEAARKLAEEAASEGAFFLDAPVSGSGPYAVHGELTIMVGGDETAFQRVLPVLKKMGRTVELMGPSGAGATTKIINNLIMATNVAVAYEGLVLGTKVGIDPTALFEVVRTASGASRGWERNVPRILSREFPKDGSVRLLSKDQDLAHELGEAFGVRMPVFETARAFWKRVAEAGYLDTDIANGIRVLEAEAGVEVRGRQP